jgi:hypothetical protein
VQGNDRRLGSDQLASGLQLGNDRRRVSVQQQDNDRRRVSVPQRDNVRPLDKDRLLVLNQAVALLRANCKTS